MMKLAYTFAFALTAITTPALAGSEPVEIRVQTADLDLASQKDRDRLQARLKSAAKEACASERTSGIRGQSKFRSCIIQKTAAANTQRDALYVSEGVTI